ncbi:hypothetical protein CROQUDRAFT_102681 [Cronartium quercuum f. sp. fusiforme G11]|uniref:Uncharacterized protein n=1 Tax=Cronartium quercuum f. sp. fusiforme G11 TaxID=708437 RepID=A0A9P6N574_9BASI|nr:hypothetical protein CROQUDRAFT_102681 [Cronartium quercuum f. sp. fusiforme G11]
MEPKKCEDYKQYVSKKNTEGIFKDNTRVIPPKSTLQLGHSSTPSEPNPISACLSIIPDPAAPKHPTTSLVNCRTLQKASKDFEKWLKKAEMDLSFITTCCIFP